MLLKGLKFGMLLQLAIGPVCIFILNLGSNIGFVDAEMGVIAVTLVDAIFVLLAIFGISTFIRIDKIQKIFRLFGAFIVAYFGFSIILGVFDMNIMPDINLFGVQDSNSSFINGFLLTASNPLTILFWTGVFSTKITEEKLKKREVYLFGAGAVLATFLFLSVIAFIGSVIQILVSTFMIKVLNVLVGIVLIYFACTKIVKKV